MALVSNTKLPAQHFHQMTKGQALLKIAVVDKQIDHARHLIDYIDKQQIE